MSTAPLRSTANRSRRSSPAPAGAAHAAAVCLHHGAYQATITPRSDAYLDLAPLYRNLVKELALTAHDGGTLHVMVKGGDWVFGSLLVDEALQAIGLTRAQLPARLFCPQVVTDTGAKLSKSLIRAGRAHLPEGAADWMLPDAPEAYGAMITRPKAAPAQSRSTDLDDLLAGGSDGIRLRTCVLRYPPCTYHRDLALLQEEMESVVQGGWVCVRLPRHHETGLRL
ncbi:hypothetical protein [Streptomyces spongiae]|uniref:hypothetical protein n=1 Tax=Streptomyces spongiae TaxID=565072 RepID=UPI00389AB664